LGSNQAAFVKSVRGGEPPIGGYTMGGKLQTPSGESKQRMKKKKSRALSKKVWSVQKRKPSLGPPVSRVQTMKLGEESHGAKMRR